MDRAAIVVDLGFGDAGKGLVTDYLVRALGARLVVRYHGGAQAGHNVVTTDGRHHTFAQLGAGSFVPGVASYLGRGVVVHPTALRVEAAHLASVGVPDALERLHVSEQALIITPFQQAAGRLRELGRGARRHGSCGVGVGEAVRDALADAREALRAGHLRDARSLRPALLRLQARKREELRAELSTLAGWEPAEAERAILEDTGVVDRWLDAVEPLVERAAIVDEAWLGAELAAPGAVVLEGAQGVLLDEWAGFHPHTTWSTCTFEPALALLREHTFAGETARIGVLRTYAVRHGAGPLPTEDAGLDALLPEHHNSDGPWQGRVRRGWPDMVLARYALEASGGADALALTHLDALGRVPAWRICTAYEVPQVEPALFYFAPDDTETKRCARMRAPRARDLERQAALGIALGMVMPVYEAVPWGGRAAGGELAVSSFEEHLGVPVRLVSAGPSADHVNAREPLFAD